MDENRQEPATNRQKRTRNDLLNAAATLIRAGKRPSIVEVAEAASISRRTAYRYFPSQERLLADAALELLRPAMQASYESAEPSAEARIDALVREMQRETAVNEQLLRTVIRLTIERDPLTLAKTHAPVRGRRRIDWIEGALQPARAQLSKREFERLVSAIALCVGAEALIVLRDVRGMDPEQAADVSRWAARALVRQALVEASNTPSKKAKHRKVK